MFGNFWLMGGGVLADKNDKNVNASQLCRPAIKEIRALRRTLKKKVIVHKMFNCVLYAYQIAWLQRLFLFL